jgi:hypothetical protein
MYTYVGVVDETSKGYFFEVKQREVLVIRSSLGELEILRRQ